MKKYHKLYLAFITLLVTFFCPNRIVYGISDTLEMENNTLASFPNSGIEYYSQEDNFNAQVLELKSTISINETYYFSNNGNDENDGLSSSNPKRNPIPYIVAGNCKCLFKSGEIFTFDKTISVGSNVVLSTYGGNNRAGFSFVQQSLNTFQSFDGNALLYCISLNPQDSDSGWISIDGKKNWKRRLDPNLSNENEYYIDKKNSTVYVRSETNLTGKNLNYALSGNGLYITGKQNVIVDNIEICGTGSHGINILSSSNIMITNCYIHDVGGTIQETTGAKYGNGIQIWANCCNNIVVYKNIVTDCFDAGITAQIGNTQKGPSANIFFLNNFIERCNYGFEAFHSSTNYPLQNVVVSNNIFYDIKDITYGYRLTKSSTDYTALLCLWNYTNPNSSILISHNFGFKSQSYAISYSWRSPVTPPIQFVDNTLITTQNTINYPSQYTGDNAQCYIIDSSSKEFNDCERNVNSLRSNYNFTKAINL